MSSSMKDAGFQDVVIDDCWQVERKVRPSSGKSVNVRLLCALKLYRVG
jgi:hypothetical protein